MLLTSLLIVLDASPCRNPQPCCSSASSSFFREDQTHATSFALAFALSRELDMFLSFLRMFDNQKKRPAVDIYVFLLENAAVAAFVDNVMALAFAKAVSSLRLVAR